MLHFFTNGVDMVIAEDVKEAIKLWEQQVGEGWIEYGDDKWRQVPDDEEIALWIEVGDKESFEKAGLPDGAKIIENQEIEWGFPVGIITLAGSWVKHEGRGYWGCKEF